MQIEHLLIFKLKNFKPFFFLILVALISNVFSRIFHNLKYLYKIEYNSETVFHSFG